MTFSCGSGERPEIRSRQWRRRCAALVERAGHDEYRSIAWVLYLNGENFTDQGNSNSSNNRRVSFILSFCILVRKPILCGGQKQNFSRRYGYRWCEGELLKCGKRNPINLGNATTFTRPSLVPCSSYTVCVSISNLREIPVAQIERWGQRLKIGNQRIYKKYCEIIMIILACDQQ